MKKYQAGLAPIAIVVIVVAVLAIGGGVYYATTKSEVTMDTIGKADDSVPQESNTGASLKFATVAEALASGKSVKCEQIYPGGMTNIFHIASGKIRTDVKTPTVTQTMILSDGKNYIWNDLKVQPDVVVATANESSITIMNRMPLNDATCREVALDASVFAPPANAKILGTPARQ